MSSAIAISIFCFGWLLLTSMTHQSKLRTSQTHVLMQLRKHLEYPVSLGSWNYSTDICNIPSSSGARLRCTEDLITELRISGEKFAEVSSFDGHPVPNQTLSEDFSIESFITTLSRLSGLRVVSLINLGIWGSLPDKIHRLSSLEVLDLSSNFLYGSIPPMISTMAKLQVLTLDRNFFNETLPNWFHLLPDLSELSLKENQFSGRFPPSIGKMKKLNCISLSSNYVSGVLPDLSGLTRLKLLDLRVNRLISGLPALPETLVTILLSQNSLSGDIPSQFVKMERLQHLDLSLNSFIGVPPTALFTLPNLSYLNLSGNLFSGSLPSNLSCGDELGLVDISDNRLMGMLPSCLCSSPDRRVVIFSENCNDRQNQYKGSCCRKNVAKTRKSVVKEIIILSAIIGVAVVSSLLVLRVMVFCWSDSSRGRSEPHTLWKSAPDCLPAVISSEHFANARYISQTMKQVTEGSPAYRLYSLDELKEATNNFDQSTFMGYGSFGKIYKGRLENGSYAAIRKMTLFKRSSIQNLKMRLDMLSKLRHPHLVCLLGHCIDGGDDSNITRVFLVYEYIPNGNFHGHLSEKILNWSERLAVLIGSAKAVHFLHTGVIPGFIKNRLKAKNILLDEHRLAKLSDCGLSIISEISKPKVKVESSESSMSGSNAWEMAKLEDDIYSFGFILLEALVGAAASVREDAIVRNEMVSSFSSQDGRKLIVDPIVLASCTQESLSIVIRITNKCLSSEPSARPSIEDVLWNLQYAAQVQAVADGDQRSDCASEP